MRSTTPIVLNQLTGVFSTPKSPKLSISSVAIICADTIIDAKVAAPSFGISMIDPKTMIDPNTPPNKRYVGALNKLANCFMLPSAKLIANKIMSPTKLLRTAEFFW